MTLGATAGDPRSNVGDRRMRVDLSPSVIDLQPGDVAEVLVEVTNTSDTIREFQSCLKRVSQTTVNIISTN